MDLFHLEADQDLNLMAPRQTLTHVTCAALQGLREDFRPIPRSWCWFKVTPPRRSPLDWPRSTSRSRWGMEAGLRADNLWTLPGRANRRLLSQIATLTSRRRKAEANLKASGVVGTSP